MPKEMKPDFDALMTRCLLFVDRNGEALGKGGNPFSSWLRMRYRGRGLKISMQAQCSPHSNGSRSVTVRDGKMVVFSAHGNFMPSALNVEANVYASGDRKKKIPKVEKDKRR